LQLITSKVRELQLQYESYIASVRSILKKNDEMHFDAYHEREKVPLNKEECDNDEDEFSIDSFMVVNRSAAHLKASTESYIKDQQLDELLPTINANDWGNYTEQVLHAVHNPEPVVEKKRATTFKTRQVSQNHSVPSLKTKQTKRKSLTALSFARPMHRSQFWLSSFFGPRKKPNGQWGFHHGVDMAAHRGTPVKSVAAGVVEQAESAPGYGNTIVIAHDAVYKTRYAHLDAILVTVGQKVKQGDVIGKVGDTGFTRKIGKDASHLHLEVYEHGKQVNPMHLIDM